MKRTTCFGCKITYESTIKVTPLLAWNEEESKVFWEHRHATAHAVSACAASNLLRLFKVPIPSLLRRISESR